MLIENEWDPLALLVIIIAILISINNEGIVLRQQHLSWIFFFYSIYEALWKDLAINHGITKFMVPLGVFHCNTIEMISYILGLHCAILELHGCRRVTKFCG